MLEERTNFNPDIYANAFRANNLTRKEQREAFEQDTLLDAETIRKLKLFVKNNPEKIAQWEREDAERKQDWIAFKKAGLV